MTSSIIAAFIGAVAALATESLFVSRFYVRRKWHDRLIDDRNELASQASVGLAAVSCIESEIGIQRAREARGLPVDWSVLNMHVGHYKERFHL